MQVLVIIPARGGSKGIPRKNLRSLNGNPLLYYSVRNALGSAFKPDVYVSTDDAEIASIAVSLGAKVVDRGSDKAQDETTLDPVIFDAFVKVQAEEGKVYDLIVTLQPTSPLLSTSSLDSALAKMVDDADLDTIISASDDTHLTWRKENGRFVPNYVQRVNRQYLDPVYKETGGFLITRSTCLTEKTRIGSNVALHLLSGGESIDIDTYEDWSLCEYYLKRKKILFVVSGYEEIGLGHVYNTLLVANDILNHQVEFLVDSKSGLAFDKIASKNYRVYKQTADEIVDDIRKLNPDVVINDRLDTSAEYVKAVKNVGCKVINFEDLGPGARFADLVINAIYPEKEVLPKHYFGHDYIILRDEFFLTPAKPIEMEVTKVLLTFGGVDPNNYTSKVISAIERYCIDHNIEIIVVAGFGYAHYETLAENPNITIHRNSMQIAEHMRDADIIFTSAGRTTYEVASLNVPAIVLAQNERELTHFFASAEYGFANLGLGTELENETILQTFVELVESYSARQYMSELMAKVDLSSSRKRVLKLISNVVEGI